MNKSYVTNCTFIPKDGEKHMFIQEGGEILATLDGYAIIPKELYEELTKEAI